MSRQQLKAEAHRLEVRARQARKAARLVPVPTNNPIAPSNAADTPTDEDDALELPTHQSEDETWPEDLAMSGPLTVEHETLQEDFTMFESPINEQDAEDFGTINPRGMHVSFDERRGSVSSQMATSPRVFLKSQIARTRETTTSLNQPSQVVGSICHLRAPLQPFKTYYKLTNLLDLKVPSHGEVLRHVRTY